MSKLIHYFVLILWIFAVLHHPLYNIILHLMLFVVLGLLAQCLLTSVAAENVSVSLWLS